MAGSYFLVKTVVVCQELGDPFVSQIPRTFYASHTFLLLYSYLSIHLFLFFYSFYFIHILLAFFLSLFSLYIYIYIYIRVH